MSEGTNIIMKNKPEEGKYYDTTGRYEEFAQYATVDEQQQPNACK